MDVNKYERLSNVTLRRNLRNKLKERKTAFIAVLYLKFAELK